MSDPTPAPDTPEPGSYEACPDCDDEHGIPTGTRYVVTDIDAVPADELDRSRAREAALEALVPGPEWYDDHELRQGRRVEDGHYGEGWVCGIDHALMVIRGRLRSVLDTEEER